MNKPYRILISGGGTGGHIFPALAIAGAIRRKHPDADIRFVGAEGRMEMERVPAAGYPITGLPVAGFDRRRLWRNIGVLAKLCRSMFKARKLVKDFKPDIAIGVGGYASGPTLKAAQRVGIPTLLQEQNSYAGVTNRLLAGHASAICVAYSGMERFFDPAKIVLTGNPVRHGLSECSLTQTEAKTRMGFDPAKPLLLVVGGSLGARTINEAVQAALPELDKAGVQLMWQCGKVYADGVLPVAAGYTAVKAAAFVDDMATAYRAADLVVARAGAGTISELELLGKPSILIPSPNVAEDHQRHNAEALVNAGAAVMIPDAEACDKLDSTVLGLINDTPRLETLGRNARSLAIEHSAELVADRALEIISRSRSDR